MKLDLFYAIGGCLCLGIAAQWLAARMRQPSILLLLLCGILVGPVLGWLRPATMWGPLLLPLVSLSVALILFEGGLSLKIAELQGQERLVLRLVTIGALVTWTLISVAAHEIAGLGPAVSLLMGAILVVTGPTVVGPLLSHVRPRDPVGAILRWEGIVIDPIGAALALTVYEAVAATDAAEPLWPMVTGIGLTLVIGVAVGFLVALLVYQVLSRHLVPDELESSVVLMFVLLAHLASQAIRIDSGLFAVTAMGIVLANQRQLDLKHIAEFKESLRVLLLSFLFVTLGAGLQLSDLTASLGRDILFLLVLVVVVRPLCVLASTFGSPLGWREQVFMACVAPRGIVAASVSSVFGLRLAAAGDPQAARVVPLTFIVIIGTVGIYSMAAPWLARRLGIARPDPQGLLLVGAQPFAQAMGRALVAESVPVLLVDTNPANVQSARMGGLPVRHGNVMSAHFRDEVPHDIGRLLALTPNDDINSLAALHWSTLFGRSEVYQLAPEETQGRLVSDSPRHLRGRVCFGATATFATLSSLVERGAVVKSTHLTTTFDWDKFKLMHGGTAVPLFLISETRLLQVVTEHPAVAARPGDTVIYLSSAAS